MAYPVPVSNPANIAMAMKCIQFRPELSLSVQPFLLNQTWRFFGGGIYDMLGLAGVVAIMCTITMGIHMRTNIVIDDKLMEATLKATGIKTKREVVEEGLRTLLRLKQQTELRKLRGKYEWVGDLDAMRRDK